MNYEEAIDAITKENKKVRLPEWRGYWFNSESGVKSLLKNGDIEPAWTGHGVKFRDDFEIANGLDFGWAICALKAGKSVQRAGWVSGCVSLSLQKGSDPTSYVNEGGQVEYVSGIRGDLFEVGDQDTLTRLPGIIMNDNGVISPAVLSIESILAEDWQLYGPY